LISNEKLAHLVGAMLAAEWANFAHLTTGLPPNILATVL
jgi:hypothetical protein